MMTLLKIAFRNIFRQKRRTLLTALTMFGGFALSSVTIAWSDGTYNYIINMFTRNQLGHIQIHRHGYLDTPSLYKTITHYQEIGKELMTLQGVESWSPRLFSAGLVSVNDKSTGAKIIGIDPEKEETTTKFDKKIVDGRSFARAPRHEALIGIGLAKALQAKVGDTVVIVSQAADGSLANDLYAIVGTVATGDRLTDQSSLYLHLSDAQELFVLENQVHEIAVICDDLDDIPTITEEIKAILSNPSLSVEPWQQFARQFYQAMRADQKGSLVTLAVVILVVAVGVLNTVLMTVLERRREYGVLRAVGTSPQQIFSLVLMEVMIMSLLSCLLGAGAAYLYNSLLSTHGIALPTPFTYGGIEFSRMFAEINARSFYIPAICVVASAMLVAAFPAAKAARTAPAKAMRMH